MKTGKVEEERKERGLKQRPFQRGLLRWKTTLLMTLGMTSLPVSWTLLACLLASCLLPIAFSSHPSPILLFAHSNPSFTLFALLFSDSCNVMSFKMCLHSSFMTHRQVSTWFPTRPRLKQVLDPSQQQFDTPPTTMCVVQPCLSETLNKN